LNRKKGRKEGREGGKIDKSTVIIGCFYISLSVTKKQADKKLI
jgi:hypothetical protein